VTGKLCGERPYFTEVLMPERQQEFAGADIELQSFRRPGGDRALDLRVGERVAFKNKHRRRIARSNERLERLEVVAATVQVIKFQIFERLQGGDLVGAAIQIPRFSAWRSGSRELMKLEPQ